MKEVTIKIEGAEWENAIEEAFKKENKKAKIDGFRQGKAPKDMFIKKYGIEGILYTAAEDMFHEAYHKMIDANKDLEIVARPKGDIKELNEKFVEYNFALVLRPEVKLGKYKDLGVKKEKVTATEKEIDEEVNKTLEKYSEVKIKDSAVANGDVVSLDFEGFKDGVPFEGGKAEGYSLEVGSNSFIPGFEEELIGLSAGEEKEFEITFPENYHSEDLKGQVATFKVKINEVKEKVKPELSEDFFKDLNIEGVNSEETLREVLKSNIETRKETENENKYLNELFDAATKELEVEIPEEMISEEVDRMVSTFEQQLKMQQMDIETYLKMLNTTMEDLRKMMEPEALGRLKSRLLLEEISVAEKIEVTEEEAKNLAKEIGEKHNVDAEEVIKMYGGLDTLIYESKMRKAIDVLKS